MNKLISSTLTLIALLMCLHHIFVSRILSWILTLTLLFLSSASYASPPPSNEGHFCKVIDYEEIRARYSRSAATKQALNLNVGEPRTVRMIYFLPNDRPFRQGIVDSLKVAIRLTQTLYADQMQAHGYGRKTFRFETDAQGEPLVHRVDGQYPDSHYISDSGFQTGQVEEIAQKFDMQANNVYLIVADYGGVGFIPHGGGGRYGGLAQLPATHIDPYNMNWQVVAHELGHAFGLWHDFRSGAYIMSYGARPDRLSACHAEFLAVHPYFNTDSEDKETPNPIIELTSSLGYLAGSINVSVQLKVSDPDGLHQVILFVETREPHLAAGAFEVKACRGLAGKTDAVVQFDYDGVIPSDDGSRLLNPDRHPIYVEAVDIFGNASGTSFDLICENCPLTLFKISGDNQEGVPGTELANPLIIEVRDKNGAVIEGVPVTFTVTAGDGKFGGKFTDENAITDANGRAQSTLTLGPNSGTNTVAVSIAGSEPVTFNAVGVGTTTTPITGGEYQKWHLPDGAIARLGKGRIGQSDRSVAFSPDGQRLAVVSQIGVWLYDVATSRELALFKAEGRPQSVAFSPDGTILALGSNTVRLWDVATQKQVANLVSGSVNSVAFSPDGTMLASGASDNTVQLWDVATQKQVANLEGHRGSVNSVAFSPDGTMLASGVGSPWGGRIILLWDIATKKNIATLEGHTQAVQSVAFSPDGTMLASGSWDNTVKLWDVATWTNIATLEGHTNRVLSVVFSPDGTILASGSNTVKLWDVATQTNIATLVGHTGRVSSVAFSPDGTMLSSASENGRINLWDIATQNIATPEGATGRISSLAFSPDGTTFALGTWNEVKLWDVATRTNIATLERFSDSVAFSPDGTILASGTYNALTLWDVATRTVITTLQTRVSSVVFSPDGATLASSSASHVKLWDVATRTNIATLEGHTNYVYSVAFSPDGTILASGSDDSTVKLWDVATRTNIATLEGHTNRVFSVAFSPDGKMLASGEGNGPGSIKLWDVATRALITTLTTERIAVRSVAFSPDGSTLAAGVGDGSIRLWDVATRTSIAILEGHSGFVNSVTFSPDGSMLASGADDRIILFWDMSKYVTPVDNIPNGNLRATTLLKISGDKQEGPPSATLANPLVVEVKDQNGNALEGIAVSFAVTAGGGTLSTATDTTDANGRAQTTLTLGSDAGTNTVSVTVAGIEQPVAFTGEAVAATSDFDGDGTVNIADFLLFVGQFGFSQDDAGYEARFDLDGDGVIGIGDFLIFVDNFGNAGS